MTSSYYCSHHRARRCRHLPLVSLASQVRRNRKSALNLTIFCVKCPSFWYFPPISVRHEAWSFEDWKRPAAAPRSSTQVLYSDPCPTVGLPRMHAMEKWDQRAYALRESCGSGRLRATRFFARWFRVGDWIIHSPPSGRSGSTRKIWLLCSRPRVSNVRVALRLIKCSVPIILSFLWKPTYRVLYRIFKRIPQIMSSGPPV